MSDENKKKILIVIACILAVTSVLCGIFYPDKLINNTIKEYQNIVYNEIKAIDENIIIQDVTENDEISSYTEEIVENEDITLEDEIELEEEIITENESFELQDEENISYDGDRAQSWNVELGEYKGLTYYSQIDSRWKNILYTSIGNTSQTIGSSGCGPTSAAMVVSSIKGAITPDTMANLFVKYGYRSANNGTYWSAYRAVANEFNIGYTETSDIQKALDLLRSKNYVICSVGNGLFTTGGHYIVIVGIENDSTLKIFDPYLYNGKFETSTRRGKVAVEGNTIYCSIDNFKKYSNYKGFFCYQDIEHSGVSKYHAGDKVLINDFIGIAYKTDSKYLVDNGINQYWIHKSVVFDDNRVYGLGVVAYDGGKIDLVQIFDTQFWVSENNMTNNIPGESQNVIQIKSTVGQNKKLRHASIIYQNQNLSGLKFNYKANTTITILENVNSSIDKIKVNATGRIGYIDNKNYK